MNEYHRNSASLDFAALSKHMGSRIRPDLLVSDPQVFDSDATPEDDGDRAAEYRHALARKLNRLVERWKPERKK